MNFWKNYKNTYFVTMLDVLEHVVSPNSILKEVNRILKREGLILATVPNVYGVEGRVKT